MDLSKESVFSQKFNFESDLLDIRSYFEKYGSLLNSFEKCREEKCKNIEEELSCESETCKNDEFYLSFLGISKNELKELKKRTSVKHLKCDGDIVPVSHDFYKSFDEEKNRLKSTTEKLVQKCVLTSVSSKSEMIENKNEFPRGFFKYSNYQWCIDNYKPSKRELSFNSSDLSNVVACVKVYHPFLSGKNKSLKIKLLQEIHILGNQTLAQLRDKIVCSMDHIGDVDISNEFFLKEVGLHITARDEYPSSFIFIENTFYNDTRSSKFVDLSKELREWATTKGLGPFKTSSMENTSICDMKLRLGRPYVFQHQGNCEHIIIFSDIRFLELGDPAKSCCYPRTHCTGRIYGKHCMMCADSYARYLVIGNERLTHDKTYLCKRCFVSYNYINGRKVGKFEAYKYVDPIALL